MDIKNYFALLLVLLPFWMQAQKSLTDRSWKEVAVGMDEEWYGTSESIGVAENILLYQRNIGGWPKNIPMHHALDEKGKSDLINDKSKSDAIFDNDATTTEMRFLARMFGKRPDVRYREAFEKGLNFILEAQYANGGWPMFYPLQKGYYTHITYNDNGMVNILKLLREISVKSPLFVHIVTDEMITRAKTAFDKGVKCILRTQYIQDGIPTVWCAQHDENTFEPAPARTYELPSLSGSESAGIVGLLMLVDHPSPEIINSVKSAIAWFDKVKIRGYKVEAFTNDEGKKDRRLVADPNGPDLWARFYDMKDNTPFFCSRDGIKRYSMSEISYERRNGYEWYVGSARTLSRDYAAWKSKWKIDL